MEVKAGQTWQGLEDPFVIEGDDGQVPIRLSNGKRTSLSRRYISEDCRLLKDEHGEPVSPEDVMVEIYVGDDGVLRAKRPPKFEYAVEVHLGRGSDGWTLIGFQFEVDGSLFPSPLMWARSDHPENGLQSVENSTWNELRVAKLAVWRKLVKG